VSSREIQTAVRPIRPVELAKLAVSAGTMSGPARPPRCPALRCRARLCFSRGLAADARSPPPSLRASARAVTKFTSS
jgi:hypothetical protein